MSVERVVSGNGLVAVYEFLCEIYHNMYGRVFAASHLIAKKVLACYCSYNLA